LEDVEALPALVMRIGGEVAEVFNAQVKMRNFTDTIVHTLG